MNQFMFCLKLDGDLIYGLLKAQDGQRARQLLEEKFKELRFEVLDLSGVTSKTFSFKTISNIEIR